MRGKKKKTNPKLDLGRERKAGEQDASWSYSDYTEIAAAGGGPDAKNVFFIVLSQSLRLLVAYSFTQ